MALENAKRLYEHFKAIGNVVASQEIEKAYPELLNKPIPKESNKKSD